MVPVWAGKKFPDTRQNKNRLEFVRAGEAVRTACWLIERALLWARGANSYGFKTEKSFCGRVAVGD